MMKIFVSTALVLKMILWLLLSPVESSESAILVAEIKDQRQVYIGYNGYTTADLPFDSMKFCIGSSADIFTNCPCGPKFIGCDQFFLFGQSRSVIYDVNVPDTALILSYMQDGIAGGVCIGQSTTNSITGAYFTQGSGNGLGMEEDMIDGINAPPDLKGTTIDFIRLNVKRVAFSAPYLEWDISWEFWGGIPPAIFTVGQRSDVDNFLMYASPIDKTTDLDVGQTSFNVHVFYGSTINPDSFEANLNRVPFYGFHPVAGTRETVAIPLGSGRNILQLQVDGIRLDGRWATDRDALIFNVP